jgi:hypothetical protein
MTEHISPTGVKWAKFQKGDVWYDNGHLRFGRGVLEMMKRRWRDKDVELQVTKAEQWLSFNPPKKNYTQFFCKWLIRSGTKHYFEKEERKVEADKYRQGAVSEPKQANFNSVLTLLQNSQQGG